MGGAWVCVVCWWMLDMHAFLDFFTPAFTTGVLYSPGLVLRTSPVENIRLTFSGPENKTIIRLNGYA